MIIEKEINEENLYISKNFTKNGIINENKIIEQINSAKNRDNNEIFLDGKNLLPLIVFQYGNKNGDKFKCPVFSQKNVLQGLISIFEVYIKQLNDKDLSSVQLVYFCLNVLIFIRNSPEFSQKEDVFSVVKIILYNFLDKVFLFKHEIESKTENKNNGIMKMEENNTK